MTSPRRPGTFLTTSRPSRALRDWIARDWIAIAGCEGTCWQAGVRFQSIVRQFILFGVGVAIVGQPPATSNASISASNVGHLPVSAVRPRGTDEAPVSSDSRDTSPSESAPEFDHDVMAVLSRAGCNQGICHGNQNGKGGFKLSLRGENPSADFRALTEEYGGRRVNRLEPTKSLILQKATAQLAHQGGQRFQARSLEYELLAEWIAGGAERHEPTTTIVDLQVSPRAVILEPGQTLTLDAEVQLSDQSSKRVNALSVFDASGPAAEVDAEGTITAKQLGESSVIVRYLETQIAVDVAVVGPPLSTTPPRRPPRPRTEIDRVIEAKLAKLRMEPSPTCGDTVFVRRAFLDTLGRLPTATEAREFVDDRAPAKRTRLIDELVEREEFAQFWALKWSDLLRNEEKVLDQTGVTAFHGWIKTSIQNDMPIDEFAQALIRSRGSTYENPPANFYRALRNPQDRGEAAARLFLGVRLQCARCHNHPFERWTQDDYYSWAAVFARVDYEIIKNERRDKLDKHEFNGEQIVKIVDKGSVKHPRTGEAVAPRFLGEQETVDEGQQDRLLELADWMSEGGQRRFAQVQANWVWYHLMGQGIVDPIDDFRLTNRPSNEPLLDGLAQALIDSDFKLRELVRLIMRTDAYQRSSMPNESNAHDERNYSHNIIRRISAEPLLDAQNQVLGTRSQFAVYPDSTGAVALPGALVRKPANGDRFLQQFGKPTRQLGCECERSNETTLSQAFALISGPSLHERLESEDNRLNKWIQEQTSVPTIVDELFWSSLSRAASNDELAGAMALVEAADDRRQGLQDLAWALLNSKEFIFRR